MESIEFAHLELLAGGEGQGAQGSYYSSKEEVQYAVEVLKAWLAKRVSCVGVSCVGVSCVGVREYDSLCARKEKHIDRTRTHT